MQSYKFQVRVWRRFEHSFIVCKPVSSASPYQYSPQFLWLFRSVWPKSSSIYSLFNYNIIEPFKFHLKRPLMNCFASRNWIKHWHGLKTLWILWKPLLKVLRSSCSLQFVYPPWSWGVKEQMPIFPSEQVKDSWNPVPKLTAVLLNLKDSCMS